MDGDDGLIKPRQHYQDGARINVSEENKPVEYEALKYFNKLWNKAIEDRWHENSGIMVPDKVNKRTIRNGMLFIDKCGFDQSRYWSIENKAMRSYNKMNRI
ncbi:20021_t:CDS:2 [Racocetra persica]|uniref:20021_t:CDS:1 n=1 Tax=Racocetra persica TaxID=160502 RepID=A0ACA9N7Z0_9GLOM|nr:20021_t:CDS:2 [Racocetra persica]